MCLVIKGKSPIFSQMGKLVGASFKVMEVMVYLFSFKEEELMRGWFEDRRRDKVSKIWREDQTYSGRKWVTEQQEKLDVRGRR